MLALGGVQGRESLIVRGVANGVAHANRLEVEGSAASAAPSILASGSDTNINITLTPKGTGQVTTTKLEVNSAANTPTFLANGETDNPQYPAYGFTGQNADNGSRGTGMYLSGDSILAFATAGTQKLTLLSDGKLLVGPTASNVSGSDAKLQVQYTKASQFAIHIRSSDADSGGGGPMLIQNLAGTEVGKITSNASSTAYNTSSDYRLKENVTAISDGITRLKTLKPSRFNFKIDTNTTVDGFLAHEITAVPEAVTGTKDEVDSDNNPVYQGIDQSKLVPLLTAALQEAIAKIEVLETKVTALQGG